MAGRVFQDVTEAADPAVISRDQLEDVGRDEGGPP